MTNPPTGNVNLHFGFCPKFISFSLIKWWQQFFFFNHRSKHDLLCIEYSVQMLPKRTKKKINCMAFDHIGIPHIITGKNGNLFLKILFAEKKKEKWKLHSKQVPNKIFRKENPISATPVYKLEKTNKQNAGATCTNGRFLSKTRVSTPVFGHGSQRLHSTAIPFKSVPVLFYKDGMSLNPLVGRYLNSIFTVTNVPLAPRPTSTQSEIAKESIFTGNNN